MSDKVDHLMSLVKSRTYSESEFDAIEKAIANVAESMIETSQAEKTGNIREAMEASFKAGQRVSVLLWLLDGNLTGTKAFQIGQASLAALNLSNLLRSKRKTDSKAAAIQELLRRHKEAPKTSKTSILKCMSKVDGGDRWGSYRSLVEYCAEVTFDKLK